jgi:hypothetical protein
MSSQSRNVKLMAGLAEARRNRLLPFKFCPPAQSVARHGGRWSEHHVVSARRVWLALMTEYPDPAD